MRLWLGMVIAAAAIAGAFSGVGAQEAEPAAVPAATRRFELVVGDEVMPVELDRPFRLKTAEGTEVEAVLREAASRFTAHGLSFLHPPEITPESRVVPGLGAIDVDAEGVRIGIRRLLLSRSPVTLERFRAENFANIRKALEEMHATFDEETGGEVRRTIAGAECTGVMTSGDVLVESFRIEVYTLVLGGRLTNVICHFDDRAGPAEEKLVRQVLESLAPAK